jgi:hypothetical protein
MCKTILGCAAVIYVITCLTVDLCEACTANGCSQQTCSTGASFCQSSTIGSYYSGTAAIANFCGTSGGGQPGTSTSLNVTDCTGLTSCSPSSCSGDYPSWGSFSGGDCTQTVTTVNTKCAGGAG